MIYLLVTASVKEKCKRLSLPRKGPILKTKRITSALFRIKLRNALLLVNHNHIKPCCARTLPNGIVCFKLHPDDEDQDVGGYQDILLL